MAATRTDVHRPAELDPADYVLVAEGDRGTSEEPGYESWYEHVAVERFAETGHPERQSGEIQCQHCGQHNLRYYSIFLHRPTGELLLVGYQCAAMLELDSRSAAEIKRARERNAKRGRLEAWRAQGDNRELEIWLEKRVEEGRPDEFFSSLLRQLTRKGELSEKQVAALRKSREREAEWAREREAEKASEPDAAPVPETSERIEIVGKVLGVKFQESAYGTQERMLVLDDRGFKLFGTRPESLVVPEDPENGKGWIITADFPEWTPAEWLRENTGYAGEAEPYQVAHCRPADRGDRVRFTAAVERSEKDETFGFFKRPTKAEPLEG